MTLPHPAAPTLLYDGTCGVCARSVQFILARDRRQTLRFAPLHGVFAQGVLRQHPELHDVDSVVWYDGSGALVQSDAVVAVLRYLGGAWSALAMLAGLVPRQLRDAAYAAVARRRLTLAARACLLPAPEQRPRFLP